MDDIKDVIKGVTRVKRRKGGDLPMDLPFPDPGEVKGVFERILGGVMDLKDLPKTLLRGVSEANEDFREADSALRSTRVRGKRR